MVLLPIINTDKLYPLQGGGDILFGGLESISAVLSLLPLSFQISFTPLVETFVCIEPVLVHRERMLYSS
jgi:hypothetical protein